MKGEIAWDHLDIRKVEHLELLARQVVEGFIIGLHKSPFHGFSVEFAEHRLYNQGESIKDIDWKVFARTDRMYVKKFEEETNLRCRVIMDISSSMNYPAAPEPSYLNKLNFSALAAASIFNLLRKQRDAFGLSLFADKVYEHTRARSSYAHYQLLCSFISNAIKKAGEVPRRTSLPEILHTIAESIHRRSLVVLFSDLFDNTDQLQELFSALQHLKYSKHELLIFHVYDAMTEYEFEFSDKPHIFVDLETGEKLKVMPHEIRDRYNEQMKKHIEEIRMKCLQYKIDFIPADVRKGFKPVLERYLVKRSKMN